MAAYLIAQVTIRDVDRYKHYTAKTPEIIKKYGGRFLVRGGPVETLEGEPRNQRIVVVEFPSMEVARSFYHSQEYQEARELRTVASEAHFVIVEGAADGAPPNLQGGR